MVIIFALAVTIAIGNSTQLLIPCRYIYMQAAFHWVCNVLDAIVSHRHLVQADEVA